MITYVLSCSGNYKAYLLSVVFGFTDVVYGKQPVVLAAFNRKNRLFHQFFTFGETTSTAADFRRRRPDMDGESYE